MEIRVLVAPGTTRIALEIQHSLIHVKNIRLFGVGSSVRDAKRFNYVSYKKIGRFGDPGVLEQLEATVKEWGINFVFFAHDSWINEFRGMRVIGNAQVIGHNPAAVEICSYKSKTYSSLGDIIRVPRVYSKMESPGEFPVFIKPDRGQGSVGSTIIKSEKRLNHWCKKNSGHESQWVISEYLPGPEYTVDCFSDSQAGLLFSRARQRIKLKKGLATSSQVVNDSELLSWAELISSALGISGSWFFQVKKNSAGENVLMEVGLRIAGASGVQRLAGVNLPLMSLYQANGAAVAVIQEDVTPKVWGSGFDLGFVFNQIFVDFDDTIIVNSKLNSSLLKFLKRQKRNGVGINVISKNIGDLPEVLRGLKLGSFFEQVIQVPPSSHKRDFILTSDSFLFIDDSFSERLEIKEAFLNQTLTLDSSAFSGRFL
jgi:hypothetical protein